MKKISFYILLAILPFNCYADIYTNSSSCLTYPNNNLIGCFQNKTNGKINKLSLMEITHHNSGAATKAATNLSATLPGYYAGFYTSVAILKKDKVSSVEYSIITGNAGSPQILPGCKITISINAPSRSMLILSKSSDDTLHC